ncbi:methyltransferase [Alteromonas sp. C1M14]|uniref:tRNA1(Val) (adenine(37)-N6)-methyltransferase n=1 Tax=Alteromonas sp. C1M14 TaxID=2841567 RepID=UPI001D963FB0|nr:methyltransferase [Alteromonas sp. C1M14]MBU2976639.1 methyltransferase [Alteromonas sp. C1M14]
MAGGFQCKQFFVAHDACAMKVSTDSLILGSWAKVDNGYRILDIGTGTGLLTLMLMQKAPNTAFATAVEIDEEAVEQAKSNVLCSPWASRIDVLHTDITTLQATERYDVIISNPPYFAYNNAPTTAYDKASNARLTARLDTGLGVEKLMNIVAGLLADSGVFYCVYPASRDDEIRQGARQNQLNLRACLHIASVPGSAPYLHGYSFTRQRTEPVFSSLTIRDENQQYTSEYRRLCKDYYLHF